HRRLAPRGLGCTPPPSASSERAPRHGPPPVGVAIKPGRRFDATFMTFRLLGSVPNTVFETLQYLRLSQLFPFALVHALMDGASVLIGGLLPLLTASVRSVGGRIPLSPIATGGPSRQPLVDELEAWMRQERPLP